MTGKTKKGKGKAGRKCVFVNGTIHTRLKAIVPLMSERDNVALDLQSLVDAVLAQWLQEHPVVSFLPPEQRTLEEPGDEKDPCPTT